MRLYYHPASTCSLRVLLTANHLNIELDLVSITLFQGEQNSKEFTHLNPNHQVPVLEDNGFVLWESYAIMQYLADQVESQSLYPHDVQTRSDINRWLFWCGQSFMPGASILNWENSIKTMASIGPADPIEVTRGEQLLTEAASILDKHLADREWLCDSGLSLADYAIAAPLASQQRAKFPVMAMPNLQRWLKQIQTQDVWQRSWNANT